MFAMPGTIYVHMYSKMDNNTAVIDVQGLGMGQQDFSDFLFCKNLSNFVQNLNFFFDKISGKNMLKFKINRTTFYKKK